MRGAVCGLILLRHLAEFVDTTLPLLEGCCEMLDVCQVSCLLFICTSDSRLVWLFDAVLLAPAYYNAMPPSRYPPPHTRQVPNFGSPSSVRRQYPIITRVFINNIIYTEQL